MAITLITDKKAIVYSDSKLLGSSIEFLIIEYHQKKYEEFIFWLFKFKIYAEISQSLI